MECKKDFPIFDTHPSLVYMDSAATSQKPRSVIEAISGYMQSNNSNIHRGSYEIAEQSEELYWKSKKQYASLIGAEPNEIIYTYNATYAFNMVAQSLVLSGKLQKGDIVLLPLREHHANIVPRQMLAEQHGIIIQYIAVTEEHELDRDDFQQKYTDQVKVVALSMCSNSTGTLINVQKAKKILSEDTLLIIDGSQIVGKRNVNVKDIGCDIFIATAHKLYAMSGLGMLYMSNQIMQELQPPRGGGAMIEDVTMQGYIAKKNREGREPGTPNIIGAISLGAAVEYIEEKGLESLQAHDEQLVNYFLQKYKSILSDKYVLIGKETSGQRIGIFSLIPNNTKTNLTLLGDKLGMKNVAVRTGGHCTHPYRHEIGVQGSLRLSFGCYTDTHDIDAFVDALIEFLE